MAYWRRGIVANAETALGVNRVKVDTAGGCSHCSPSQVGAPPFPRPPAPPPIRHPPPPPPNQGRRVIKGD